MERGNKLIIEEHSLNTIISTALEAFPEECCGFFYSKSVHSEGEVCHVLDVENDSDVRLSHFRISADNYSFAEKYADEHELVLRGVYHSHPNHSASPSRTDLESAFGDLQYVIISVGSGVVNETRGWQLDENMLFKELEIEIRNSNFII